MKIIPNDIYQPTVNAAQNTAGSILIVTADNVEDIEFFYPFYRFVEEGFRVDVVTPKGGEFKGKHGLPLTGTKKISEVDSTGYDLMYIPGGKAPSALKDNEDAVELTRRFVGSGKPVASICHGPKLLAKADVIQGMSIAAWPEIEEELTDAGATFVNEAVNVEGQFITARWPGDLPGFMTRIFQVLKQPQVQSTPSDINTGDMNNRFAA